MKILILGAGQQGQAAAHFFVKTGSVKKIVCVDANRDNLKKCERHLGAKGVTFQMRIRPGKKLSKLMKEADGIFDSLPYALLETTTRLAIEAGAIKVDLGGNNEMVMKQKAMHDLAVQHKARIIPACGLAPGLVSDLGYALKQRAHSAEKITMYCGGLPIKTWGELNHAVYFSTEGLYNEYVEPPEVIVNSRRVMAVPLAYQPDIYFSGYDYLEAALTHGGFDTDLSLWEGVSNVSYATLRYQGHFAQVRELLKKYSREECVKIFNEKLKSPLPDLVVARVTCHGDFFTGVKELSYEFSDYGDEASGLTAMQRCTAFPAAETLLQAIKGDWPTGVLQHERHVDVLRMMTDLRQRGIHWNLK
jgi:saccharopine dehydrogenase-like NADP-dependent oxidoreductase